MGKKIQEEIRTNQIGSFYLLTLRDGCDLHKVAGFEASQNLNMIGGEVWRFSSFIHKLKVRAYNLWFAWIFRNSFRFNPFYRFRPEHNVNDNKVAKSYCQRGRKY